MDIVSLCPLKTAALAWQPRAGAHALTILCKATFALRPDESPLAQEHDAPAAFDTYPGGDVRRSLLIASDLCPFKRRADVLFSGHAHAPNGRPTRSLVARLIVGKLDKSIEVHADRAWTGDGQLLTAAPFLTMPIAWERTARSAMNPVGIEHHGAIPAGELRAPRRVPNLVPAGFVPLNPQQRSAAVGFGPIAPTWPSRIAILGRHALTWDARSWNTQPLPEDMDAAFFNAAPPDQQLPELTGDETLVLEHLSPGWPRLVTRLQRILPRASVRRENNEVQDVRLRCDTLSIDGDRGVAALVFRGVVLLSHPAESGIVTITAEGMEAGPEARMADACAVMQSPREDGTTTAIVAPDELTRNAKPALPFIAGESALGVARVARAWSEDPAIGDGTGTVTLLPEAVAEPALPIHVPPPPMIGPVPVPERPAVEEATTGEPRAVLPAKPVAAVVEDSGPARLEPAPIKLSLEQVAAIAAEIAEERQDQATVLEAHGLRERGWRENEQRWRAAIEDEATRGRHTLRAAYDAAYVARVEQFRGAITLDEYARILVALDRGRTDDALDALKIQRQALMPIVRSWTKKVAKDMKLAEMASEALRAAERA